MKNRSLQCLSAFGVASLLVAAAPSARASSFSLFGDQSVTNSGIAGAGGAAVAYDASTIFYNPAGMSFLDSKLTITNGVSYIVPSIQFSNNGSVTAPGSPLQQPTTGGSTGPVSSNNAGFFNSSVPQFYVAYKVNDRLSFGVGVNAPFGLETDYNETSVLRYNATNSRITNVNINPSVSFKILDNLSIGAGFNAGYTQAGLSSAIDFGLINAQFASGVQAGILNNAALPAGLRPTIARAAVGATAVTIGGVTPQVRDGFVRFGGEGWGYGWNVGLLYEPIKGTRLGLAFRSNLNTTIDGHSRFTNVPAYSGLTTPVTNAVVAALTPIVGVPTATVIGTSVGTSVGASGTGLNQRFITNRPISAGVDLPMSASGSFVQKVTPAFSVLGDVTWIRWSSIQQIAIIYNDLPALSPTPLALNYKNAFRYSLGATYETGPALFRLGLAYDNTPVESRVTRTPRLPDSDRITIGAGLSFKVGPSMNIDLAYDHLFFQASNISNSDNAGHVAIGKYNTHADIFSAGGTIRYGRTMAVKRPEPKTVYTK